MKRLIAVICLWAFTASAVETVVLDPSPGTYVGQKATIKNRSSVSVSVAGDTLVNLGAAVTLGPDESYELVWNGTHWVALGTFSVFSPMGVGGTAVTFSKTATFAWDFPALGNAALETPCSESGAQTVTGAAPADHCMISSNLGADGGEVLLSTASLSCNVSAANAVKAKLCVQFTDGGTYDLHDAGFTVRTMR